MRLVPYLYASFATYLRTGLPPFRPLVVDYPGDANVYPIDTAYLIGPSLLIAPAICRPARAQNIFPGRHVALLLDRE